MYCPEPVFSIDKAYILFFSLSLSVDARMAVQSPPLLIQWANGGYFLIGLVYQISLKELYQPGHWKNIGVWFMYPLMIHRNNIQQYERVWKVQMKGGSSVALA